jgi:hypothetical protein
MNDNLEGDVIYRSSMAFFLALRVDESPTRGISHKSIALYLSYFTGSESLMDMSRSNLFVNLKLKLTYQNFPHHKLVHHTLEVIR